MLACVFSSFLFHCWSLSLSDFFFFSRFIRVLEVRRHYFTCVSDDVNVSFFSSLLFYSLVSLVFFGCFVSFFRPHYRDAHIEFHNQEYWTNIVNKQKIERKKNILTTNTSEDNTRKWRYFFGGAIVYIFIRFQDNAQFRVFNWRVLNKNFSCVLSLRKSVFCLICTIFCFVFVLTSSTKKCRCVTTKAISIQKLLSNIQYYYYFCGYYFFTIFFTVWTKMESMWLKRTTYNNTYADFISIEITTQQYYWNYSNGIARIEKKKTTHHIHDDEVNY